MNRTSPALALALASVVVLTGCAIPATSSDVQAPSTETGARITASPATGPLVTGDGFEFHLPAGWQEMDAADVAAVAGGPSTALFAADMTDADGFADNVNVVSTGAAVVDDTVEDQARAGLESVGAEDIEVRPRIEIAGSARTHLSATLTTGTVTYATEQYYLVEASRGYVVTFSFSPSVDEKMRSTIAESALATWTWV
ncbi:hypothetical protein ACO03V_03720 [Microbacterium sp. HMH0099]|uniref:hypothetical protein n=1 Tax=Microbacterium sp. HMH0099 TaxID=3414026 RepID=UPI003BF6CB16